MTVVGRTQDPVTGALTIEFSNGQLVGPLQLGSRPIRPRSDWTAGIDYLPGDFVTHGASGYVPRGDGVYFLHETGQRSLYVALTDIEHGEALGEIGSGWGILASTGAGGGGGGGGGAVILVERFEKLGPVTAGLVGHMVIPAPCSLIPDGYHFALLGTALGSAGSCNVTIKKNGTTVFSIVINGTETMSYAGNSTSFAPGDILRVETSTFSSFGAAADLSVTLTLSAGA